MEIVTGKPLTDLDQFISDARSIIFNFQYPFFDEGKRADFEQDFILHFLNREIGYETPALFKIHLQVAFRQLMPYYNKIFSSELSPLYTHYERETGNEDKGTTRTTKTNVTQDSNSFGNTGQSSETINKYSDTPQNGMEGVITNQTLTNATVNNSSGNVDSSANSHSTAVGSTDDQGNESKTNIVERGGFENVEKMLEYARRFRSIQELFFDAIERRLFMNIYHAGI